MTYNSLQGISTTMIGFVTCMATLYIKDDGTKGGQVTKPIIVVKMPCKLLYVIQVKEFLIKCSNSWPYLISEFLVAYDHDNDLLFIMCGYYSPVVVWYNYNGT